MHAPCCSASQQEHGLPNPSANQTSTAWSFRTPSKILKIESNQNKTARFVAYKYDRTTSVTGLQISLNCPTQISQWNCNDCLMWHKIHHGLIHISFPDSVLPKQKLGRHDHTLAYRHIFLRVEACQQSFYNRTIPLWNGLPVFVATTTTLPSWQRLAMSKFFGLATP